MEIKHQALLPQGLLCHGGKFLTIGNLKRLGYGIAPKEVIDQMRPLLYGSSINALVKYGAVAALKDTAYESKVRQMTRQIREQVMAELRGLTTPSECASGRFTNWAKVSFSKIR